MQSSTALSAAERDAAPAPHRCPFLPHVPHSTLFGHRLLCCWFSLLDELCGAHSFVDGKRSWGKKKTNRLKGLLQVGRQKEFWLRGGWEDGKDRANGAAEEVLPTTRSAPQHSHPAANVREISLGSTPALDIGGTTHPGLPQGTSPPATGSPAAVRAMG